MGFLSSFFSGNPNVTVTGEDAAMAIATVSYDIDTNSPGIQVGLKMNMGLRRFRALVPGDQILGQLLGRMYTTVRGKDGKINVPLTLLDTAAKALHFRAMRLSGVAWAQ
jgi:hypothetical protein